MDSPYISTPEEKKKGSKEKETATRRGNRDSRKEQSGTIG